MSRKQLNKKVDSFESDSEKETPKIIYLYVPYIHKDDARRLGARFDAEKKQWYITDSNENKQELIKLFNSNNFITTKYGPVMKSPIKELIKSYESESDEESQKKKFEQRHYLLVPFAYKDDAKELGARFDMFRKEWYTDDSNENKQKLIDLYHTSNFIHTRNGPVLKSHTMTLKQVQEKEEIKHQRYKQEQKKWIEKYGSEDGFGEWYSENFKH